MAALLLTPLAACDTGDGTRLAQPTSETTLPPPDTSLDTSLDDPLVGTGDVDGEAGLSPFDPLDPTGTGAPATGLEVFAPWVDGGTVDTLYTCDGANASPPISWVGLPEGTTDVAVVLVDETDVSGGRPFVHWVIAGLGPSSGGLGESEVPAGAIQGLNFFGEVGYDGPCPPPGETHVYRLSVLALGQQVELPDATPAAELLDYLDSISLADASTTVMATR